MALYENIDTSSYRGQCPATNSENDAVYVSSDDWCIEFEFSIGVVDVLGCIKCYSWVYHSTDFGKIEYWFPI